MASLLLRVGSLRAPPVLAFHAVRRVAPVVATGIVRVDDAVQAVDPTRFLKDATSKRHASHFSHEQPPHTKQFIEDKIMLVLRLFDKIDPELVTPASHFLNDLGLDSLDHVEIITMMEEEFMFEFPNEDWERLYTAKDIQQYVCDRFDVFH